MAAIKISEQEFRRQVAEARRRGRAEMARELQAKSVRYDRDTRRIVVDLKNGSTFIFLLGWLRGLPAHLRKILPKWSWDRLVQRSFGET